MTTPRIELLAWAGCPSHPEARRLLDRVLAELGHPGHPVAVRWVETEEDARALRFLGSPTVLVDGRDVVPPDNEGPYGLTCRIYRTRTGRISPVPDEEELREALERAFG